MWIPPTFLALLLVYALFLNEQTVKGDCSLDSLSDDICSSDTCSKFYYIIDLLFLLLDIVKDLPQVTDVYRGQSVEVCTSATSDCIKHFVVYINCSDTTDFTVEQIRDCYIVKYEVDNADYNLTVRIEYFYRNNLNLISCVSSNTITINVKRNKLIS